MAIFTDFANYLKCKAYFEDTLGFRTLVIDDNVPDYTTTLNPNNPNEEFVNTNTFNEYGLFSSLYNIKIAINIWFFYGKATPWNTYPQSEIQNNQTEEQEYFDDNNPPRETEDGFEIITTYPYQSTDVCGFLLDTTSMPSDVNPELIGLKRLVPLPVTPETTPANPDKYIRDFYKDFKNVIQFRKYNNVGKISSLSSYDEVSPDRDSLNTEKPNSLKIQTSYEYDDFGFKNDKEYNVRQIGMVNLLHARSDLNSLLSARSTLYNGVKESDESNTSYTIRDILNVVNSSAIIPNADLNVHPIAPSQSNVYDSTDFSQTRSFVGVLHFYVNTAPNNRVTYQTDYYNFLLTFENKVRCNCDCENCINNI